MATISVTGAARRLITPDRGTARVVVRFEEERRGDALAAARRLHDRLTSEARRLEADGAATEWSADQVWVSTSERSRGERKEPKRVTVATASVRVTFVDLTALGAWLADVAEREGASVYGIEWSVSEERRREVEAEVRTEAALDALHRARAYASAVGLETVELTALDEPGLRRKDESSAGSWSGVALGRMPMAAAPAPDFDVRPDDLEVRAEVTADFTAH